MGKRSKVTPFLGNGSGQESVAGPPPVPGESWPVDPWATISRLARRVGHELRNPLGAINNVAYFINQALKEKDKDEDLRLALHILHQEVVNANKILTDLLVFAAPDPPRRQRVQVHQLIAQALEGFQPPALIRIEQNLAPDLPPVRVDGGQIAHALAGLISNAVQAIDGAGCVRLTTSMEGGRVRIAVSDTGEGIPRENLEKIFQPLFTTKARGLGLGLATSRRLVEQNDGHIGVDHRVGTGTTFFISLPIMGIS